MSNIKTKIVCTIGPATWNPEVLKELIDRGMTVARINASFADAPEIARVTKLIRSISKDVAVLLDLQGHKIRISDIGEPREVKKGDTLILDTNPNTENIFINYDNLHKDIKIGGTILIDDGKINLKVKEIKGTEMICEVQNHAVLKRLKTVNMPGTYLSFDPLTEKDKVDIVAGVENNVDFIAGSFVRDIHDVKAIQERIEGTDIKIIAKIEDPFGVKNFDEILQSVHGIMVARGDLGVELPYEEIPLLQKEFIKKCNAVGKPVIVATHMLESMITSPRATRAEVSDISNAVFDGTDALMLSAESSTGSYPIEAVETMATIAKYAEKRLESKDYAHDLEHIRNNNEQNNNDLAESAITIAKSTYEACNNLPIKAVIVLSSGGFTARMIARHKISQPIYAYVATQKSARQLALSQGIYASKLKEMTSDRDRTIQRILKCAIEEGKISNGDLVAIVIGSKAFKDTHASVLELQRVS